MTVGPAWYTADRGLLVPDGDPRAAFLAAGPADDIPTDVPWDAALRPEEITLRESDPEYPPAEPARTAKPRKRSAKTKG